VSREPTLLEDLLVAADICCEYGAMMSGQKKTYLDPVPETPIAARLRAHAARLRAEMEECARAAAQPNAVFERADLRLYERINGGPLER